MNANKELETTSTRIFFLFFLPHHSLSHFLFPTFSWSPGTWESGTPYSLSWTQKEKRQKYTWEESLSLVTMEQWVRDAIENSFTYAMKSQLVCEGNYVSSTLSALVCDCVSEDGLFFVVVGFLFCF